MTIIDQKEQDTKRIVCNTSGMPTEREIINRCGAPFAALLRNAIKKGTAAHRRALAARHSKERATPSPSRKESDSGAEEEGAQE